MRATTVLAAAIVSAWHADACSWARSGLAPPDDAIHNRLASLGEILKTASSSPEGVMPDPVDMSGNAFVSHSLLRPPGFQSGEDSLSETLLRFQAKSNEDLCYWSFQALPPPVGGPTLLHPFRKYWDVDDGSNDQDIEWVQALGEVAAARLHQMQLDGGNGGPVASAMCTIGTSCLKRRCDNGRAKGKKCSAPILKQTLRWPMAIAIFNISEQLSAAVTNWRGNASHHYPNIQWILGAGTKATSPWNGGGPVPVPGDLDPPGMPHGPDWPASKGVMWGASPGLGMIAKVMPCSQIPAKLMYRQDLHYCDRVEDGKNVSSTDEAYAVWRSTPSVWPPTTACKDDLEALTASLNTSMPSILPVNSCADALKKLQAAIPNYGCNIASGYPRFRDMCCSACGSQTMPYFPAPAPGPPPAPKVVERCRVCQHVYDPAKDGAGKAFEDLPDTWRCPVCGAPKAEYYKTDGEWVHAGEEVVV